MLWETQQPARLLQLHSGPKTAQWTFPILASSIQTQRGHVRLSSVRNGHSHQVDTRMGTPTVQLTFQGGNAMPVYGQGQSAARGVAPTPKGGMAPGLRDWYSFLELISQPPRVGARSGEQNFVKLLYSSVKFPSLLLYGFFTEDSVSITDDSNAPFELEWTGTFEVHDSQPRLDNAQELADAWAAAYAASGSTGA